LCSSSEPRGLSTGEACMEASCYICISSLYIFSETWQEIFPKEAGF
jgi:hypothetical protein